ncbi:Alpha/beta hydrolase fold [gamma proteobacterium HdN1]|nr:Alpha/beta hydrolase fold [gamma proteobacterium HdN1]
MAEHSARYAALAEQLTNAGCHVYAHDARGHGYSVRGDQLLGHYANHDGWNKVVNDLRVVNEELRSRYPGVAILLLGHSMGSFIARAFVRRFPYAIDALLLSGSASHTLGDVVKASTAVTIEKARLGAHGKSKLLDRLSFATYNRQFAPNRTSADWLSRDTRVVDEYIRDPLCGFLCTNQFWSDLISGIREIRGPESVRPLPKRLPVLMFSGELDPLSYHPKAHGIYRLAQMYERAGMQKVTARLFAGGRHEILNETNRDEVFAFIVQWLRENKLLSNQAPQTEVAVNVAIAETSQAHLESNTAPATQ